MKKLALALAFLATTSPFPVEAITKSHTCDPPFFPFPFHDRVPVMQLCPPGSQTRYRIVCQAMPSSECCALVCISSDPD